MTTESKVKILLPLRDYRGNTDCVCYYRAVSKLDKSHLSNLLDSLRVSVSHKDDKIGKFRSIRVR